MALHSELVRFGPDKVRSGFLVVPPHTAAARPLPGIILIQEAWGVDAHIRDLAHRFAGAGYGVLAPDLFSEGGVRPAGLEAERIDEAKTWMDTLPTGAWMDPPRRQAALAATAPDKASRVQATLDIVFGGIQKGRETHLAILKAAQAYLREDCEATRGGRLASVGFCMGGGLSGQLAVLDPELAGAVIFYGNAPDAAQMPSIACPVLAFHGETDARLMAGLPDFEAGMRAAGKSLEVHVLPGAGHAFLNDTRASYNAAAARVATARCLSFLNEVLG